MIATDRLEVLSALVAMGNLYPSMRFGQLFEFVTQLATDERVHEVSEVEDDVVLRECRKHLEKRSGELGVDENGSVATLSPARRELMDALGELSKRHPDWQLGKLLANLAEWADVGTYDAEDPRLLEAAKKHLGDHICAELWGANSAGASLQPDPSLWDWSDWRNIQDPLDRNSCVVYQVRLLMDSQPWEIKRFLGVDGEGILSIGRSTSMERRRKQFINGEIHCCGHSEANLLYFLRAHSPFLRILPDPQYQYRFVKVTSEIEAMLRENRLIKDYIKRFGEPPPLNCAVPDRYGEQVSWCE